MVQLFRRRRRNTNANIDLNRHQRLRRFESILSALELLLNVYILQKKNKKNYKILNDLKKK